MSIFRKSLLGGRAAVKLGNVSPLRPVPEGIRVPSYVGSAPPEMDAIHIKPKRGEQLRAMREACTKAATALAFAGNLVREGRTTDEIDHRTHEFIVGRLACYPSPLGYSDFPKAICTSINEVLCHGIPDDRPLQAGDLMNIDVSVYTADGYHGDCSEMFGVGPLDEAAQKLVDVTRGALDAAIAVCAPGKPYSDIGDAITEYVETYSTFAVVDEFTGHGIGTEFHMQPYIVHTPNLYPGTMKEGHTFTIEPVVVEGSTKFKILRDDWTAISKDSGRGAQKEHTILITADGHEILTFPDESLLLSRV